MKKVLRALLSVPAFLALVFAFLPTVFVYYTAPGPDERVRVTCSYAALSLIPRSGNPVPFLCFLAAAVCFVCAVFCMLKDKPAPGFLAVLYAAADILSLTASSRSSEPTTPGAMITAFLTLGVILCLYYRAIRTKKQ